MGIKKTPKDSQLVLFDLVDEKKQAYRATLISVIGLYMHNNGINRIDFTSKPVVSATSLDKVEFVTNLFYNPQRHREHYYSQLVNTDNIDDMPVIGELSLEALEQIAYRIRTREDVKFIYSYSYKY